MTNNNRSGLGFLDNLLQHRIEALFDNIIKPSHCFVKKKQSWLVHNSTGKSNSCLHPTRELMRILVGYCANVGSLKGYFCANFDSTLQRKPLTVGLCLMRK